MCVRKTSSTGVEVLELESVLDQDLRERMTVASRAVRLTWFAEEAGRYHLWESDGGVSNVPGMKATGQSWERRGTPRRNVHCEKRTG